MKNNILYIFLTFFLSNLIYLTANSAEQFNFDVTEIEILNDGNIIKGIKKGTVKTNDGITINANTFIYNKLLNILTANGNVEIIDSSRNLKIYSDYAVYQKNNEIVNTERNSKAIYDVGKFIFADNFQFNRNENIINANGKVKIEDTIDNYIITGDDFTYFKNTEKIISNGKTKAFIQSKYEITSKNVTYFVNEKILKSENKTQVNKENSNIYFLEKFNYQLNQEILVRFLMYHD